MNLINCSSDCTYQKDGYCCLDFVPEIHSVAVEGCHYYKKAQTIEQEDINIKNAADEIAEHH